MTSPVANAVRRQEVLAPVPNARVAKPPQHFTRLDPRFWHQLSRLDCRRQALLQLRRDVVDYRTGSDAR